MHIVDNERRGSNHLVINQTVNRVLLDHLPSNIAPLAQRIWEQRYQQRRVAGIVGFLRDITELLKMPADAKHNLRMDLYRQIASLGSGLSDTAEPDSAAVPAVESRRVAAKTNTHDGKVSLRILQERGGRASADVEVFAEIGDRMIRVVRRIGPSAMTGFSDALREDLSHTRLPELVQENILEWAAGNCMLFKNALPQEQLTPLLHMLYAALCITVGPAAATAMQQNAVDRARRLPEAALCPPEQLL